MIDAQQVFSLYNRVNSVAVALAEEQLEGWQTSDGEVYYDADREVFVLTYSYETVCDCCSYEFGQIVVSLEAVQEALNAT